MKKGLGLAFLVAAALAVSGFSAWAETDSEALVAAGDRVIYTVKDGEALLAAAQASAGTQALTSEEAVALRDAVVDELCNQAALYLQYEAYGLNEEDPEETRTLDENTQTAWESAVSDMAAQLREIYGGSEEDSLVTARALMKQTGITVESLREQVRAGWRSMRLAQAVAGDVTVTDAEIEALYLESYVTPDREKYENNLAAFEEEVLFGEESSCFVPEGYRLVQWILMPYPQETGDALRAAFSARDAAFQAAETAYGDMFGTFESEEARTQAREAYDAALAGYGGAYESLEEMKLEVLAEYAAVLQEISDEAASGASWDDLIKTYSADLSSRENPYPLHAESSFADPDLLAAGMSIEAVGGVAEPVVTEDGVLLVRWSQEAVSGAVPLDEKTRDDLREILREEKQAARVQELVPLWREEYGVRSWPERLAAPGK